jgi:hypothetical protein
MKKERKGARETGRTNKLPSRATFLQHVATGDVVLLLLLDKEEA